MLICHMVVIIAINVNWIRLEIAKSRMIGEAEETYKATTAIEGVMIETINGLIRSSRLGMCISAMLPRRTCNKIYRAGTTETSTTYIMAQSSILRVEGSSRA